LGDGKGGSAEREVISVVQTSSTEERKERTRGKLAYLYRGKNLGARHWRSLKPRPVDAVPWAAVERTKWCSGGMGGATLMQVGSDECVVLKTLGLNAVAEVLAFEVAALLGVRVAASRPLASDAVRGEQRGPQTMAPEFLDLLDALGRAPMEDQTSATVAVMKHRTSLADFVVIMEFVPGSVLQGTDGMRTLQDKSAPSVLEQLGSLIALDCVLNNVDRVPAIWHNDGNLSNIMITPEGVVGIDQQVNAIADTSGKEKYFRILSDFCSESALGSTCTASAERITGAVRNNCGVELTEDSVRTVLKGAAAVFQRVKTNKESLTMALKALDDKMRGIFGRAGADVGLAQVERMTDFLVECVEIVASAS